MSLKRWYDSIGTKDGIFDVEDIKAFRRATGVLICSIVNRQKDHQQSEEVKEFCKSFQQEQGLSDEEAKKLFLDVEDFDAHIDKQIEVIKEQLKGSNHKKLEFMHTLNRFIVENDCPDGDYTCFQMVLKKLFDT